MLSIKLDKPSYARGETVVATVKLDAKTPVMARSFIATLVCVEKTDLKGMELKGKEEVHVEKLFELEQAIAGKGKLAGGDYYVSIKIPEDAPPSDYEYGQDHHIRIWTLYVKLDVPLAPDQGAQKEVMVQGIEDE